MAALKDEPANSRLGRGAPIAALCILCHDADAVLPFYCDVLGFEPRRAEESFYHFARRGSATALCLWEIGHVTAHTVYTEHSPAAIPNKFVVSLTLPSHAELDDLYTRLMQTNDVQILARSEDGGHDGFFFVDPCAAIWDVRLSDTGDNDGQTRALERITLLCQDATRTSTFYESMLGYPAAATVAGRRTYPPVSGTALSLWDAANAATTLGLPALTRQQKQWTATTAMLAHSFETLAVVCQHYQSLQQVGVNFDEAPKFFAWDFNACYFRDPEDNIWELFETPSNIEQRMLPQTGGK